MPQYLSTDPNAGLSGQGDRPYLSADPMAGGGDLAGKSAAEAFFGPHHPTTESGEPLGAVDRLLEQLINPTLREFAQPDGVTDLAGLAIPSVGGLNVRVPLVNMLRETLGAAKQSQNWRSVPGDVLDRLLTWVKTPASEISAQRTARAPRLAGKAPSLTDALTDALQSVRETPAQAVSLPGGNTMRVGPRYQDYRVAGEAPRPAGRAYSSEPMARPSSPTGTSSGAPPAATAPVSARSAPPPPSSMRLTPEEAQALQQMVQEGYEESAVLKAIAEQRAIRPTHAPATSKPALNAAEAKEFRRLTGRGMDPKQAMDLIEQQRALAQKKGLPTSEQVQRAVADRNQAGRWD